MIKMERENNKVSLLSRWKNREKSEENSRSVSQAPDGVAIPLSSGQQRLWYLQQLYPENPVYNFTETYTFHGLLNLSTLLQSLQLVYATHDVLRSSFHLENGVLVQKTAPREQIDVAQYDLTALGDVEKLARQDEIMTADAMTSFDLDTPPLLRASLLRLTESRHVLLITMHHIITDKWSVDVFLEDLADYYQMCISQPAVVPKKKRIQFTDYAYWQQHSKVDPSQLDYWVEKLGGDIPSLNLPTDFPRPLRPSFKGNAHVKQFSGDLSKRLLKLSKTLETTPYTLLLSGFYTLLFRYSGQKDLLVGSPISQRHEKSLEDIIGFFDETIVLRANLSPTMSFAHLVKKVRQITLEAFSNKEVPFDLLVKKLSPERSLNTNPFFNAMFIYHAVADMPSFGTDLRLEHAFFNGGVSKFDLTLYAANDHGLLYTSFEYATDLFTEATISRLQDHLHLLLEGAVIDPNKSISQLEMLTKEEKRFFYPDKTIVKAPFEKFTGIHQIIEAAALTNPEAIAVAFKNDVITYADLMDRSEALARVILESTEGHNKIIGLCLERSINMIVGMVAILRAGCAYLPIDPEYPTERTDFILRDSGVTIVLTQESLISNFNGFKGKILSLNDTIAKVSSTKRLPNALKDNLAYVIYTSGSTGKPKGVPITHANIINSTEGRLNFYQENPKAFLLMSSIAFDSSKAGIFWSLCTGGTLVVAEKHLEQDIEKIGEVISEREITHTLMLPSLYKLILEHANRDKLKSLTTVTVAGEACPPSLCTAHFSKLPEATLFNEYGPTEATVWSIAHKIGKEDSNGLVPIGKPVADCEIYVLNDSQSLVPFGARGEIYIGGPSLASGYINRPELSKDVFVDHPFSNNENKKLYRTGDIGRYRNDGNIEFLGRADQQVKIRGHRIELEEIEDAIFDFEPVEQVSVIVDGTDTKKQLIAFIKSGNKAFDIEKIRGSLKNRLPDYMIPSRFIQVDDLPLLPNGKIDKKRLSELEKEFTTNDTTVSKKKEATTNIQKRLVEIWEEVLHTAPIGIDDNFFEIGGDSISSIQIIAKARGLGMRFQPNDFFINPTIESMTDKHNKDIIENANNWEYLIPLRKEGSKSPLFCFHAGEGYILFYQHLPKYIGENRPIFTVQPKGADGLKKMHRSVEDMALDYLEEIEKIQPNGPYNLLFYCHGSLAVEISNLLADKGKRANLIMVDSMIGHVKANYEKAIGERLNIYFKRLLTHPLTTLKNSIKSRIKMYIAPYFIRLRNDAMGKTRIALRNQLIKNHISYSWKKFDAGCTLILIEGEHEKLRQEKIEAWNKWCKSEVKVVLNGGHHFNQFEEPHVKTLGKYVEEALI